MTPRLADTRIGVFHISKNAYDPESKQIEAVRFAKRWRLEPSECRCLQGWSARSPQEAHRLLRREYLPRSVEGCDEGGYAALE